MSVQAGLELQDGLELLVSVEGDLDHAVDVVEAVPVLKQDHSWFLTIDKLDHFLPKILIVSF